MIKHIRTCRLLTAALVASVLTACGGGGSDGPAAVIPPPPGASGVQVTGMVSKGPLDSSDLEFLPIDAFGAVSGAAVATATTAPDGSFTATIPAGSGALLIRTSGGSYIDEADREPDPALKRRIQLGAGEGLESLLPAGSTSVTISIATQAVLDKTRLETQSDNFLRQFQANRTLATAAFGFDVLDTPPANPVSPDPGSPVEQRQYAMVLGGLANLVNRVSLNAGLVAPTIETILAVAEDFSDGRIDGMVGLDPVMVGGAPIEAFSLNEEITRFRNNNFDSYAGTPLVTVDEDVFSEVGVPVNTIPVAVGDTYLLDVGGSLTIDVPGVLLNDTDGDGDTLTAALVSGPASAVDFSLQPDGSFFYVHDGSGPSPDSFSYQASDGIADSNVVTVTLTFTNSAPVANDDSETVLEGGLLVAEVLANDTDIDGDPLTATLVDFPVNGQLSFSPDGTYEYTHDGGETTADQFTYVANDGTVDSNAAQVLITVTPVNDAPVGAPDSATVDEGDNTTVLDGGFLSVLNNDTDAEMSPLTAVVDTLPVNGQLSLASDGTFNYSHDGSETTSDSFTYIVSDGSASSAPIAVNIVINPVNDAPFADDDFLTLDQGDTQTILDSGASSVLDNDFDAESDPLTAILVDGPFNGQLSLNDDGTFAYTHDGSREPDDQFSYIANDGTDDSNIATVFIQINIPNAMPIASDDSLEVDEGGTQSVLDSGSDSVLDNDFDDDQDPLEAILIDGPANGQLNLNADGTFSYTHDGSETLSDSFIYVASDGIDDSDLAQVSITINPINDQPIGAADSITLDQGDSATVLDSGETSVLANDTDAEDDPLTALLQFGPQNGDFILNPDGTFSYAHDNSATTTDSFTYIPSDADVEFSTSVASAEGPDAGLFNRFEPVVIRYDLDANVADSDPDPGTGRYIDATQRLYFGFPNLGLEFDFSLGNVSAFDNTANPDDQISIFGTVNQGSSQLNGQDVALVELGYTGLTSMLANDSIPDFRPTDIQFFSGRFTTASGTTTTVVFEVGDISTVVPASPSAAPVQVDIVINPPNNVPVAVDDEMEVDEGGTQTMLVSDDMSVLDNDFDDDQDPLTAILVEMPVNGDLFLDTDGTFSYTHDGGETSNDSFTYFATDGIDDSSLATVTILVNPINDAPIAGEDSLTVDEGGIQTVLDSGSDNVLANDFDAEDDPLSAMVVQDPVNGQLTLNPDGTLSYQHDGSETQSDSFMYVAQDGEQNSGMTLVSILVNPINDPPVAQDDFATVFQGDIVAILDSGADSVLENDFDEEGDPLTAQLIDPPQNGIVTLNPDGTFEYEHNGSLEDFDTFSYVANDGIDDSGIAVVDIFVIGTNAELDDLQLTGATLDQSFTPFDFDYTATVDFTVSSTQVTATATDFRASITVNGVGVESGVPSGSIPLSEGLNTITVVVTADDGFTTETYTVEVTRLSAATFAQAVYLKASNTDDRDIFGYRVAVTPDGNTMAVSALSEESAAAGVDGDQFDNNQPNSGAVYIFSRDFSGIWAQQAYLKASNNNTPATIDGVLLFGYRLAISADGNTVAVASRGESSSATGINGDQTNGDASFAGAAYVFGRDGNSWFQQAYIKASNTEAFDAFGRSIALSGDGDTLAVGASGEGSAATGINGNQADNSAPASGAAYVYTRSGGNWSQEAYIKASNAESGDSFGMAVSLSGTGNTLAVTASGESSAAPGVNGDQLDNNAPESGAAYVFTRDAGSWSQQAYLKTSNPDAGDALGGFATLSLSADGTTLVAGAPGEDSSATGVDGDQSDNSAVDSGAAYVFASENNVWAQQAYVKASNTDAGDEFGQRVSLSTDGTRLLVGAPSESSVARGINGDQADNSLSSSGAAYLFARDGGNAWSQQAYIKSSNSDLGDFFGLSAALADDAMVIGATGESSSAAGVNGDPGLNNSVRSGAVYVFALGLPPVIANEPPLALTLDNQSVLQAQAAGAVVGTLMTADPDELDTHIYSFVAGVPGDNALFQIAGDQLQTAAVLDASQTPTLQVRIRSDDQNGGIIDQVFQIRVFAPNNAPTDIVLANQSPVVEFSPGFLFADVVTVDPDAGDTHLLSLVSGTGDDNNDAFFLNLDQDIARIFVESETVDALQTPTLNFRLRTDDTFGGTFEKAFSIEVLSSRLSALALSDVTLDPAFDPDISDYTATVPFTVTATQVTPTAISAAAVIQVNGLEVSSGTPSQSIVLAEGGNTISVTVDDGFNPRTYTINVTRQSATTFAQQAYIKASNTDAGDQFSSAVSLSADGSTLVVGARIESSSATGINGNQADNTAANAGAVYVFVRAGITGWIQEAYIKASNAEAGDQFGNTVSLTGDGNTLAVGALDEDSDATGVGGDQNNNNSGSAGAVYVFQRDNGIWSQQAYIKASNTDNGDRFGSTVELSGDGRTLAVSAAQESSAATGIDGNQADNSASGSGAVYVFARDGDVWSQQAYIKASNTDANDAFGGRPYTLSLAADGATLVVGAPSEGSAAVGIGGDQSDNTLFAAGAAYVFVRDSLGVWSQQAYIKASNTDAVDQFGFAVAVSGSGDGLAVGAFSESSSATGIDGDQANNSEPAAGAVYVYSRNAAGVWSQQAYIKASNTQSSDNFGISLSLNADGERLLVGATNEASAAVGIGGDQTDNSVPNAGAAYLFDRNGGIWSQSAYIKASNTEGDFFGAAVALSANGTTFVSGTTSEDSAATGINGDQTDNTALDSGAVYAFSVIGSGSSDANLGNLALSNATLDQPFDPGTFDYTATVPFAVTSTQVDASADDPGAQVLVNGIDYSGDTSDEIPLDVGVTSIFVLVTAEDGTTQTYTVAITRQSSVNSTPTAIDLDNDSVQLGQPSGTPVGTFTTTDPDTGDVHLYSLVAGPGDADNALFQIVGDELQTAVPLDGAQSTLSILVRTDDQNGGILDQLFIITVLPANQSPTAIDLDNDTIDEGEPDGSVVGMFSTTDADTGDSHFYSLVPGVGDDDNDLFIVEADLLLTSIVFDVTQDEMYSIRVQTDDQNGGVFEETFTIVVRNLAIQRVWINPQDGSWSDPANWAPFGAPQPGEEVIIDLPNDSPTIFLQSGTDADVFSVDCTEDLVIESDSSLTVRGPGVLTGLTVLLVDSFLFVDGPEAAVSISGQAELGGGDLIVIGGGVLSIDMPTYFTDSNRSWIVDGPTSRLEFFDLISVEVGVSAADLGSTLSIEASGGGVIDFQMLDSILVSDGTSVAENESWVDVVATDAGSRVQMPQLLAFTDDDSDQGEPGLSIIEALGGGVISVPLLTDPQQVNIRIDVESSIDIAQLNSVTDSVLELDGGVFAFPNLTNLSGSIVRLGTVAAPTVDLSAVTMFDGGGVRVDNGTVLSMPGLTSYTLADNVFGIPNPMFAGIRAFWTAAGAGSRLEFPNLLSGEAAGSGTGPLWVIQAQQGGVVDLPALTSLTVADDGGPAESNINIEAANAGSVVQMPQLTTFVDSDPSGTFFFDMSQVHVADGGVIEWPLLTAPDRVLLGISDANSSIDIDQLNALTNGALDLHEGIFAFPNLDDLTGSTVYVRNGATVDLSAVTMFDSGGAEVYDGSVLSFPGITSYTFVENAGFQETQYWYADGAGSRLEFPNLTSITLAGVMNGPTLEIQGFAGGVVDLPLVASLTVLDDGSAAGSEFVLVANGANSLVNLPMLALFNDFDLDSMSTVEELNGGVVNYPGTAVLMNVSVNGGNQASIQQDYIKASNTGANDLFGTSVAMSADANTMIVGAHQEMSAATGVNGDENNNAANASGAAYVLVRDAQGNWTQQAYLKASNAEAADFFGEVVSISADGNLAAVSAPDESSNATGVDGDQLNNFAPDSGAVYVFGRDGQGTWSQLAYLKASDTQAGTNFGHSLSLAADGRTLAVSAPGESSLGTGVNPPQEPNVGGAAGAVYVFVVDGFGNWSQQAFIKATNTDNDDFFGDSVALAADGNTLAVGATAEDSAATGVDGDTADNSSNDSGAAYVYVRDPFTSVWQPQAYIKASNTGDLDVFGDAIALSGDGNHLAVSAESEDSAATGINGDQQDNLAGASGAVYIYDRDGQGNWSLNSYVKASNTETADRFGRHLSFNAFGDDLLVTTSFEDSAAVGVNGDQADNSAQTSGAAYLFTLDDNNIDWVQELYIKASNTETGDFFGTSAAFAASGLSAVLGATNEDSAATGINGDQADNSASNAGAVYVLTGIDTGSSIADLSSLTLSGVTLDQPFDPATLDYTATVPFTVSSTFISAVVADQGADILINGSPVDPITIFLDVGTTTITILIIAEDGTTQTYTIVITRQSAAAFAQQAYIKASNTDAQDQFGNSAAALSDDGNTLAVGAAIEDSAATGINGDQSDNSAANAGAVYVFIRDGAGVWTQQAYIKASNTDAGDSFGGSVTLSGDGNTLAVGASGEGSAATGIDGDQNDNSLSQSGAVYVYTRDAGVWSQQAYVKASNTGQDNFGIDAALSADGNKLVVGAWLEDSGATGVNGDQADNSVLDSGAAYVFSRDGSGVWTQTAYLKASNTGAGDQFGIFGSIDISDDGNTLVVGTREEDSAATGIDGDQTDNSADAAGAAYVFVDTGGTWSQQAYIKASNTDAGDNFGGAITLSGSGDTLAVGAAVEDSAATGINGDQTDDSASAAGAAYVFTRSGVVWTQQAYIKASNTDSGDRFGSSAISLSGDGNTLAVAAVNERSAATGINGDETDNSLSQAGAAYVFMRDGAGVWTQQAYIKASNTDASDIFGIVTVSGDANTLAVTALGENSAATGIGGDQADNSAANSGAAYVFALPGGPGPDIDTDGDGLTDAVEMAIGTDPGNPDTDGDLVDDFDEVNVDGDPSSADIAPGGDTDPLNPDTDGDDVGDGVELSFNSDAHVPDNVLHVGGAFADDLNDGSSWAQALATNTAVVDVLSQSGLDYYVLYESGSYGSLILDFPVIPQTLLIGSVGPGIYSPSDPPGTVFDAQSNGPVVIVDDAPLVGVWGITFANGFDVVGNAGGVNLFSSTMIMLFSQILDNDGIGAGGFLVDELSAFSAIKVRVSGNVSQTSGGGGLVHGQFFLGSSIVSDNLATDGGTITLDIVNGTAFIRDSQFLSNQATSGGAIDILSSGAGVTIGNNVIAGNFVSGEGGAINATGLSGKLSANIDRNTVAYNQAAESGGGYVGLNGCDNTPSGKSFDNNIFYFNDDNDTGVRTADDNFFVNRFVGRVCGPDAKAAFESLVLSAGDTRIDFETLATGTNLTTQIPGVSFASISDVNGNPSGPFHVEVSGAFPTSGNSIVGAPCGGCTDDGRVRYEIVFDTPHRRAGLQRIWNAFTVTRFFDDQGGLLHEFAGGDINGGDYSFVGYVASGPDTATWVKRIEIDGELDGVTRQVGYSDDLYFGDTDVGPTDFGLGENQLIFFNDIEGGPVGSEGIAADPLFVAGFYLDQMASPAVDPMSGTDADLTFFNGETTDPAGMQDTAEIDLGFHYLEAAGPQPDGVGPDSSITGYSGEAEEIVFSLQQSQQDLTEPGQIVGVCISAGTTLPNAQLSSLTTLDPVPGCDSVLARDLGDGRFAIEFIGDPVATGILALDVYINESMSPVSLTVNFTPP